jgi:hypothetical protein
MKRIGVFCGSRHGSEEVYRQAVAAFAEALLRRSLGLVYGGGNVGLMGVLADAVMAGGGEVIGVIPERLRAREVAHRGITKLHVVESMHQRKALIFHYADAIVALPGGIGTFDELFEALTWNQLGIHRRPCGLLNVAGYYDPLVAMIERTGEHGFTPRPGELLAVADDPDALLDELARRAKKTKDVGPPPTPV